MTSALHGISRILDVFCTSPTATGMRHTRSIRILCYTLWFIWAKVEVDRWLANESGHHDLLQRCPCQLFAQIPYLWHNVWCKVWNVVWRVYFLEIHVPGESEPLRSASTCTKCKSTIQVCIRTPYNLMNHTSNTYFLRAHIVMCRAKKIFSSPECYEDPSHLHTIFSSLTLISFAVIWSNLCLLIRKYYSGVYLPF